MANFRSRLALRVVLGVPLSATVACGSSDPATATEDGGTDGARDVVTTPVDSGQCPTAPVVAGAACGPEAAGGVICKTAPTCTACGYQSFYLKTLDCDCRSGAWVCQNEVLDCGVMAPGYYTDATCTTKNAERDAGTDAATDAVEDAATDAADGG